MNSLTQKVSRKIAWRLIPFLILCFFIAYLDRVNAGFAALTMNKELGLTAEMFGFGVGIFFFGYFIFEVPSNLLLEKVGAPIDNDLSTGKVDTRCGKYSSTLPDRSHM
jgi:MFS transporter, ACS family, tartrate transporter